MNCPKCGSYVEPHAAFCGSCGERIASSPARPRTPAPQRPVTSPAHDDLDPLATTLAGGSAASLRAMAAAAAGTAQTPPAVAAVSAPHAVIDPNNLVGATLNGRYHVSARIGEGGFGAVYKGEQLAMGRECAIKVLHGRMARDPQVVGRFRREAQAASVLRDPHTVATYDFDQTPDGVLYMAMELLHGRSLHSEMVATGIPYKRVAHILSGVLESLAEAHAQGIVHRDIKPENIYLESRGADHDYAKVLDFGIAKIVSGDGKSSGPQLTAAGQTLGTIEYMSPEQLMGQPLDGRSDLYAVGNLAYEMLCGHLPYSHLRTPTELITAHLSTAPRTPSAARPELKIPPSMDRLVMRLLEKKREARFKDAAEARDALQKIISGVVEPEITTVSPMPPLGSEDAPTQPDLKPITLPAGTRVAADPADREAAAPRSMGMLYVGAGVLFLLIAIAAAWFLFMGKAGAAESPLGSALPAPVRLVPAAFDSLFAVDLPALRAAAPAQALAPLMDALRPQLAELGATPEALGPLAAGASGARPGMLSGRSVPRSFVVVVDLPVDAQKFAAASAQQLPAGDKYVDALAAGIRYKKSAAGSYAILPGDRLMVGSGKGFTAALALARGKGPALPNLIDGAAAPLLARLGVTPSHPTPAYGWARLDDPTRQRLDARVPGLAALAEIANSVQVNAAGADIKALGNCATPEAAQAATTALRAELARLQKEPIVALLGFARLLDTVKLDSDGPYVTFTAHLTPAQLSDLIARVGGMAASLVRDATSANGGAGGSPASRPAKRSKP